MITLENHPSFRQRLIGTPREITKTLPICGGEVMEGRRRVPPREHLSGGREEVQVCRNVLAWG